MTRPYHPTSRVSQSPLQQNPAEVPEPPPPTQLSLPAKVLAAMAEELPRDALQSLVDETDAESIDDDAIAVEGDVYTDDEVTIHGDSAQAANAARDWREGRGQVPTRRGELGGVESEISAFRTRAQAAPPANKQDLDALFGNSPSPDSRREGAPRSAPPPPPPPSRKLNAFASRMLFEPTPAPLDNSSYLPAPPGYFAPPSERPGASTGPSSQRSHTAVSQMPPAASYGFSPGTSAQEPDEETETRVLARFVDPPSSARPAPFSTSSVGYPASSYMPPSYAPPPNSSAPQSVLPQTVSRLPGPPTVPPRSSSGWLSIGGAGLLGACAIALGAYALSPKKGELIVDVANQACNLVSNVNVYVDNELACTSTPCRLETAARSHVVYADAPGYPRTAAEAVIVESGSVTLHKLQLGIGAETGVEVRARVSGLSLSIDGKLAGDLPRRVPGLSAGEHTLNILGGDRYYPEERKVRIAENEMLILEPIDPKLKQGKLEVAAPERLRDAKVTLNDQRIELPFAQPLDAAGKYHLVAQKTGYEPFETWITFDATAPSHHIDLQLIPRRDASAQAAAPFRGAARAVTTGSGDATLNLNSRPVAMVILDGKPIGATPRVGVSVKPGAHTVIFVGPDSERRRVSASVNAGSSKNVSVRF